MATSLHNEDLVAIMCEMIKARTASDVLRSRHAPGRVRTLAPIDGHEATTVGATWALDPAHDWVLPQCREPMALGRYGPEPLNRFAAWALGHPLGGHLPEPVKVFPPQLSRAAHMLHAVGLAWALKLRGEPGVALAFVDHGARHEGDFHIAADLAGAVEVPVILLWASEQPASAAERPAGPAAVRSTADAFGIRGVSVDGSDPLAVHGAVSAARTRALAGGGATLIEAVNHRQNAATVPTTAATAAGDPTRGAPTDELTAALACDPLVSFRRQLEDRGLWDRAMQIDAERSAEAAVEAAWRWATNLPLQQTDLFDNVFATPTARQLDQRAALESLLRTER